MKTRNITSKLIGINLDWAGTWEELLEQAYLNNVWVRKTGGVYAGGHPEVDIIGEEVDIIGEAEDIDRFMEVYNKQFKDWIPLPPTTPPKEVSEKQDDKCAVCGNEVGNNVFTVCDNCWPINSVTRSQPQAEGLNEDELWDDIGNIVVSNLGQPQETIDELKSKYTIKRK